MCFDKRTIVVTLTIILLTGDGGHSLCSLLQVNETGGVIEGPSNESLACWMFQPPNQNEDFGLFIKINKFNFNLKLASFFFTGLPNLYRRGTVNPTCLFWSVNKLCLSSLESLSSSCPDSIQVAGLNGSVKLTISTPIQLLEGWKNGSLEVQIQYQFVKCNKTCEEDDDAPEQKRSNCNKNVSCATSNQGPIIIVLSSLLGVAVVGLVVAICKLRQASKHHNHHQPVTVRLNDSEHALNQNGTDEAETLVPAVYAVINKKAATGSNNDVSSNPERTITDVYAVVNKESA